MNIVKEETATYKILEHGINSVSTIELAAKVLCADKETIQQINKVYGLENLSKLSIEQLSKFDNIGRETAASLICAFELKRRLDQEQTAKSKITCSRDVANLFSNLENLEHEEFWILLLNRSNTVIKKVKISQGGISGTVIDVKLIFAKAVEYKASSIVLCHNHPSGNIQPSSQDRSITNKLVEAGKVMDCPILDHIIKTKQSYSSFADDGLL